MLKALNIFSDFVFSKNPVILEDLELPTTTSDVKLNVYRGEIDLNLIPLYTGFCVKPLNFDISSVLDAFTMPVAEVAGDNTDPVVCLEDGFDLEERRLTVELEVAGEAHYWSRYILPGGIKQSEFRSLAKARTDVFESFFLDSGNNRFLSVRDFENGTLFLGEQELEPLYFIVSGEEQTFEIRENIYGQSLWTGVLDPGIYALDIEVLRKKAFFDSRIFVSEFSIYRESDFCHRVVIEHTEPEKEYYRFRFRNRLGFFEKLSLSAKNKSEITTDEPLSVHYNRYDPEIGYFYRESTELQLRKSFNLECTVFSSKDRNFLLEMMLSNEVFIEIKGRWIKVVPEFEEMSFLESPVAPETIIIKFMVSEESETASTFNIEALKKNDGLFNEPFDDVFN